MSNIANLKSTERGQIADAFSREGVATAVAALLFTIVIISFRPFQPAGVETAGNGDIVNQLGFGSLGAASIIALMTLTDRRVLSALFSPSFLLLIGFLLFSVAHAADFDAAVRAASFTLIGILVMATVLAIPRDADAFSAVIAFAGFVVVGMSYIGLVLYPNEAMHTAASSEPQHAGLWRGVFAHKNIAGPVMACFSFAGLYLFRRGWKIRGLILLAAAMIFMMNTGSKTTAGLVPLAILMVAVPGIVGMRMATPTLFLLAMAGVAVGTVGVVFIDPVKTLAEQMLPDPTYTGRTTLWEFAGEMIAKRPWFGYGYDSFWGSALVANTDQPFDRAWDVRPVVHGHNGYLDIALIMGILALCVAVYVFFIAPLRDYMRIPMRKESIYLGDFFMMTLLFTALNSFLESFFFRRADPVWLLLVFGLIGLRLTARFSLPSGRNTA
ncbi:O-antigen ligase family protein [Pseudaminobacter sp. NGMCC 1.201702]|uniref:O-antigen ligase family protein n=1 Tax=Pseudaminobacter sp. NGMCC 1.201702 TaxID=3391825 RepID=UPI0039F02A7E